jgi:hypothetical protein
MFFGQESQPGGSSSAPQFPQGQPPHFAPQFRPGPQLFTKAHRCSHDSLCDLSSLDHTQGPSRSLLVLWGQIPPFSAAAQFGTHVSSSTLWFWRDCTLVLEGLCLQQRRDMQGLQLHLLQLLTLLRRPWPAGVTRYLLIPVVLVDSLPVGSDFRRQHTLLLLYAFC